MLFSSISRQFWIALACGLWLPGLAAGSAGMPAAKPKDAITVSPLAGKVRIEIGGKLFTEYIYENTPFPFLYPVIGPGGTPMTRNYPMKNVKGEATDHPHHRSLWFAHGDVNGIDFWAKTGKGGNIVQDKLEQSCVESGRGIIKTHDRWVGPDGKDVLTDTRTMTFQALPGGARAIDFEIVLMATAGDATFADTKEGSMAIRTHANLSLMADPKIGNTAGQAVNSVGVGGIDVWGKRAAWVDYWGKIGGRTLGVAIFDHPANPRHPTTWHAREYGLIAANPFGLSEFEKKPKGTGDMLIKNGDRVTFRYRFLFHKGDANQAKVAEAYKEYAAAVK